MNQSENIFDVDFSNTKIAFERFNSAKIRKTYSLFLLMQQNGMVKIGTFFINKALKIGLPIKKIIKSTIFEQFCGGESINDCENTILELHNFNIGTILDYSVEGEESADTFDKTKDEIIKTIHFAKNKRAEIPFAVFKITGIGHSKVLEQFQLDQKVNNETSRILERLEEICHAAFENNVRVFIDAEETWIQKAIDFMALAMMKKYNSAKAIVFNTYQFYLKESLGVYQNHIKLAKESNFYIGAKLVRGAYLEKERNYAEIKNQSDPTNASKVLTDEAYNISVEISFDNLDVVSICLGTHNEESCRLCLKLMQQKGLEVGFQSIYFAQLLGMSDNISFNLAKNGFNVAKYVPYGPIEAVMPYLFRRAAENKSIAGQGSRELLLIKKEIKRRNEEQL